MKKILLLSSLLVGSFFIIKPASAQFHLSVNIGVQPEWGPVGYDYAEYYYLPDIEAYYSVPQRQFIYFDRGNWVYSSSLPGRCNNYDLYSGYKVVINERNPWMHFNNHRSMYSPYRFRHDQVVIRDRRGFGGGNYGRPQFDNRDRGWNNGRDNRRERDFRGRDDDHGRGRGNDHERGRDHDNGHGRGNGRGRW